MKRPAVTVFAAAFGACEYLSVHAMPDATAPGAADWCIALLLGGPALFVLVSVPLTVLGAIIAMGRFPR